MNRYARYFRYVLLAGVIVNLLLAIPGLFAPNLILALIRQRPCGDVFWGRFAAFLIALVSLVDIPAAIDPARFRPIAWLAVFNRLAGIVFFLILEREYLLFGFLDAAFGLPAFALLVMVEIGASNGGRGIGDVRATAALTRNEDTPPP